MLSHELVFFMFELQVTRIRTVALYSIQEQFKILKKTWHSDTSGRCESCSTISRVDDDGAAGLWCLKLIRLRVVDFLEYQIVLKGHLIADCRWCIRIFLMHYNPVTGGLGFLLPKKIISDQRWWVRWHCSIRYNELDLSSDVKPRATGRARASKRVQTLP